MFSLLSPKQILLVTSRGELDLLGKKVVKDNVHALHWRVPLSREPEMIGIALEKTTLSSRLIDSSKVFVVNSLEDHEVAIHEHCGRESGLQSDKFKDEDIEREEAETVDCPRIARSRAFLECKVVDRIETGDHIFFVGEVTHKRT